MFDSYARLKNEIVCLHSCVYDYVKQVVTTTHGGARTDIAFISHLLAELDSIYLYQKLSPLMESWMHHRDRFASFEDALAGWHGPPASVRDPRPRRPPRNYGKMRIEEARV